MSPQGPGQHEEAFRSVMAHRTMLMAYVRAIVRDADRAVGAFAHVSDWYR